MSSAIQKQEYFENLDERVFEIENLLGINLEGPVSKETLSDQILKLRNIVENALKSLSSDIKKSLKEGIFYINIIAKKAELYKKLLQKGDAMLQVILTAGQKTVLIKESSEIIQEFVEQVNEVKKLENHLTFDPILGLFYKKL